jgi:hypothetical protein
MPALPNPSTLTYNGITFNETQEVGASLRFVEDAAGRTVTNTILTLKVKAKIAEGAGQNAAMAAIRTALERPGQALAYSGMAFGGLSINVGAGTRDLNWGPKPRVLSWKPRGRDQAAEIEWQVEVSMIGCANAPFQGQVMEATYSLAFSTDKGGYATRVHSGLIRIPMTRTAGGGVPDSADNYYEAWVPKELPGYARTCQRNLDESRSKLTFTITDTERAGNELPAGVVEATGGHTMTSEGKTVSVLWAGSLNMTYELARDQPRSIAWTYFLNLAEDRVRAEKGRNPGAFFFPRSMSIGEPEIHGRNGAAFTLNYSLIFGDKKTTKRVFPVTGLWRPIPGATWQAHSNSLSQSAQHPRGLDRLRFDAGSDEIVDLCSGGTSLRANQGGSNSALKSQLANSLWDDVKRKLGIEDDPDPSATWLHYQCEPQVEPMDHTIFHVPLPTEPIQQNSRLVTPNLAFPQRDPSYQLGEQKSPPPVVQRLASTSYYVRLVGRAVRVAYEIPKPELPKIGDGTIVDANDGTCFWRHNLATWTTHPVYVATWNLRFFVARSAGAQSTLLPIMPHPFMQGPTR